MTRLNLNVKGWKAVRVAVAAARSIFLSRRSIVRCTWLQASQCTLLQRPSHTHSGDLHCKALPVERILLLVTPLRGEVGTCTKGSKGKKGSLALYQLPYPPYRSSSINLCYSYAFTCGWNSSLLHARFQSPLYFPLPFPARRSTITLQPEVTTFCFDPFVLDDPRRLILISSNFLRHNDTAMLLLDRGYLRKFIFLCVHNYYLFKINVLLKHFFHVLNIITSISLWINKFPLRFLVELTLPF